MSDNPVKFHMPWRIVFSLLCVLAWFSMLFAVREVTVGIVVSITINAALPLIGFWYISTMSISSDGLTLYRINKLVWSEIVDAKATKIFGLKSIRVKRKKGMSWSLPLYFEGPEEVVDVLIRCVPKGNPLYNVSHDLKGT